MACGPKHRSRLRNRYAVAPAACLPGIGDRRRLGAVRRGVAGGDSQSAGRAGSARCLGRRRAWRRASASTSACRSTLSLTAPGLGLAGRSSRASPPSSRPRRRHHCLGAGWRRRFRACRSRHFARPESRAEPVRRLRDHDLADGFPGRSQLAACNPGDAIHCGGMRLAVTDGARLGCIVARRGAGAKPGSRLTTVVSASQCWAPHWRGRRSRRWPVPSASSGWSRRTWCVRWIGHEPGRVLLPAACAGALLLLIADVAARLLAHRCRIEARRVDQFDRHAVFLLAGGAPAVQRAVIGGRIACGRGA